MAGARYWRIYGLSAYGGGDVSLTELGLYEGGVRVDAGEMLTATYAPTSGDIAALSDGSASVACDWSALRYGLPGFALVYDLGVNRAVNEVRIGSGADRERFPYRFSIQSSADGITWSTAGSPNGIAWPGPSEYTSVKGHWPTIGLATSMLLFNGADGSTVFTDDGTLGSSVTRTGDVKISATQSYSGGASAYFDGSGDSLIFPTSASVRGSEDYTVSFWLWVGANPVAAQGLWDHTDTRQSTAYGTYLAITPSGALFMYRRDDFTSRTSAAGVIHTAQWTHIALVRQGGVTRGYVSGSLVFTDATERPFNDTYMMRLGNIKEGTASLNGYFDDFFVTRGFALWKSDFTPPGPLTADSGFSMASMTPRARAEAPPRLASPYAPPAFGVNYQPMIKNRNRMDFQGDGKIHSTVKKKGDPVNLPLRRKVLCMDMLTSIVVDETWSDDATGEYTFQFLDRSRKYTVLGYDHSLAYRAAIADSLTPEKM